MGVIRSRRFPLAHIAFYGYPQRQRDGSCAKVDESDRHHRGDAIIMKSRRHAIAMLLTAGASAVALVTTPVANAAPSGPACVGLSPNATQCSTNGSVSINATPPEVDYPGQWPFGVPYSLILHHGRHR
jgi:hypothetical protein